MEVNNTEDITISDFNSGTRPMKLYHVTTQDRLESILKNRIKPITYKDKIRHTFRK